MNDILYILWDASAIWGLMALRAAQDFSIPCRLVKAQFIAQGLLSRKPPRMLLVPGGSAALKCSALGAAGLEAVRDYVRRGGNYFGICGGAGLGLTAGSEKEGLGLCPWSRAAYGERMQHLISGHIFCSIADDPLTQHFETNKAEAALPVWWPGRFAPQNDDRVRVLARYVRPAEDFWIGDLALASVPRDTLTAWQELYGVNLSADFLKNQPAVVSGEYGKGTYTLSYSHTETPDSPTANRFLAHLLQRQAGFAPLCSTVSAWQPDDSETAWPQTEKYMPFLQARRDMTQLMNTGEMHSLLFRRTSWLRGWRAGIPGAVLNNLHTGLCMLLSQPPTPQTDAAIERLGSFFAELFPVFYRGAEEYLLTERLAVTLSPTMPDILEKRILNDRRNMLFGHPMKAGGLASELQDMVSELIYSQYARDGNSGG